MTTITNKNMEACKGCFDKQGQDHSQVVKTQYDGDDVNRSAGYESKERVSQPEKCLEKKYYTVSRPNRSNEYSPPWVHERCNCAMCGRVSRELRPFMCAFNYMRYYYASPSEKKAMREARKAAEVQTDEKAKAQEMKASVQTKKKEKSNKLPFPHRRNGGGKGKGRQKISEPEVIKARRNKRRN